MNPDRTNSITRWKKRWSDFTPSVDWKWAAVALIFLANLLLVSPDLVPILSEINPHDEAQYIDSGRSLTRGYLRGFEWSPLSSLVYAPIYLLVQGSEDWFVLAATVGRVILFALLWFSFYAVGSRLRLQFPPLIMGGLLFVSVTFTKIVTNPSDALFASMSALALARLLDFQQRARPRDIWLGSLFMGLAALSRNDGLFLYPVFLFAALWLGLARGRIPASRLRSDSQGNRQRKRRLLPFSHDLRGLPRLLAAALLPTLVMVGGYVLLIFMLTGSLKLGTGYRGFTAFTFSLEVNFNMTPREVSDWIGDSAGDPPSLLRLAIRRPEILLMQVRHNIPAFLRGAVDAYGKRMAMPVFYLALAGAYALWKRRQVATLLLLLAWPLHSLIYLAFYLRFGFLLMDHVVVFTLAAIGANFLVGEVSQLSARVAWSLPLAALAAYGLIGSKLAFVPAGILPLIALWLAWISRPAIRQPSAPAIAGLLIVLAAGLVLRDGYSFPNYPRIGESPAERANSYLQDILPRGSRMYIQVPLPALAARMTPLERADIQPDLAAGMEICEVLHKHELRALYITPTLIKEQPDLWELIQDSEGSCLERAFVADPGSIQIWIIDR